MGRSRSGTSLVAGILDILGVDMGDNYLPADEMNPEGYFEDVEFVDIHRAIMTFGFEKYQEKYEALIRSRLNKPLWGVKDPLLCFILPHFSKWCKPIIINVERPVFESVLSLVRYSKNTLSFKDAWELCERFDENRINDGFTIHYNVLIKEPEIQINRLIEHIDISRDNLNQAIKFVNPVLKHF